MQDQLRKRLAVIREIQSGNRRQRTELHCQLQEIRSRMTSGQVAQSQSPSPGDGVPTDPCLEQQNAVDGTLAEIAAINLQMMALEDSLIAKGDLLLEQLAILEACRLQHPETDPPVNP